VRAAVVGDRDGSVDRLRAQNNVVHHVYRDQRSPDAEYLITESFFVKFKDGTPDERIREYLTSERLVVERDMGDKTLLVHVTNDGRVVLAAARRKTADKDLSLMTDTPVNPAGEFDAAGRSLWFGHGKVNAARAVRMAGGLVQEDRLVAFSEEPRLPIPDVGAPVFGTLKIEEEGKIADLRVQVNITHSYIADLRVDLIAPDGSGVSLHNNTGGSADNLVRTYSPQDTPALRALVDRPIRGTWKLRVSDTVRTRWPVLPPP